MVRSTDGGSHELKMGRCVIISVPSETFVIIEGQLAT
jgi:hypothetical protein